MHFNLVVYYFIVDNNFLVDFILYSYFACLTSFVVHNPPVVASNAVAVDNIVVAVEDQIVVDVVVDIIAFVDY